MKLIPPMSMNAIATDSINGLAKKPKLASCVEKPPVDSVLKLCAIASKAFIPASQYSTAHSAVSST